MRLLHTIHSVNAAGGGPVEGIKQMALVHQVMGNVVEVVSLDAPGDPAVSEFPLTLHLLGPGKFKYGYSRRLVPWLRANAGRFDAVIVNGIWQYASLGVWRALHKTSTPYFVFTHGMLDPWFKRYYPLKHLKKWLYWPWAEYRVLRDARAVCFTCEEERLLARQSFWLYRAKELVVNYGTGAPTGDPVLQRELFLQQFPETAGKRLVLFLGRIHEKKGCDLLLRAFAAELVDDPIWHLVMVGPDQTGWTNHLLHLAGSLNITRRITWAGSLSGDLKWGAYRAADVFVLPSHQENFGIVVAESLACGVPALISNKVNIWREVTSAGAGLVEADTKTGTRNLLRRWRNMDADSVRNMRKRAADCFARHFDMAHNVQQFTELLRAHGVRDERS